MTVKELRPGTWFETATPNGKQEYIKLAFNSQFNIVNSDTWQPGYISEDTEVLIIGRIFVTPIRDEAESGKIM